MRILIIALTIFFTSCAQIEATDYAISIKGLHDIWQSKNIVYAEKKIKNLKLIEEAPDFQTWGTPQAGFETTPLTIFVDKKNAKIVKMVLSLYDRKKNGASFIKSQIIANDWKTIERTIKHDFIREEVSEYSTSTGVSFLYEKTDPKMEVHVIYWGSDPQKINW